MSHPFKSPSRIRHAGCNSVNLLTNRQVFMWTMSSLLRIQALIQIGILLCVHCVCPQVRPLLLPEKRKTLRDKGKPAARRGRKVMGQASCLIARRPKRGRGNGPPRAWWSSAQRRITVLSGLSSGLATSRVALHTKQLALALVFFVGLLAPTFAVAAAPELPRAYVDTAMPSTVGYVTKTVCASGCDFPGLQAAVDHPSVKNATTGIILSLKAGETFGGVSGTAVTLPVHSNPWVIIQSSDVASLPAGKRVTAADAAHMPRITVGRPGGFIQPYVIGIPASGAHHYRFIGLEVTTENVFAYYLFYFGAETLSYPVATTLDMVPHHLIVDRCYVHGYNTGPGAGSGPYSGVRTDSGTTAIIDSRISDIALAEQEVQAISATNGPGPFKIVNNYLEAAGENIIFGGG